jgi:hypothetical protein
MGQETNLQRRIMVRLSRQGVTIFRNNTGVAIFPDGSRVAYGLCPGSSDLIGWKPVTVTPDMVGKRLAVFVAVEVKPPGPIRGDKKRLEAQRNFLNAVKTAGGISGIAQSENDAENIMQNL